MYSISPQKEHDGSGVRGRCELVADCPAKRLLGSLMASPSRNFFSGKGLASSCSVTVGTSRKTMLPPSVPRAALSPEATRRTTVICERLSRPVALSKSRRLGSWKLRAPSRWAQPPKMEVAVIQQGQEVALAGLEVHLGDGGHVSVQACELHTRGHHRS